MRHQRHWLPPTFHQKQLNNSNVEQSSVLMHVSSAGVDHGASQGVLHKMLKLPLGHRDIETLQPGLIG